MDVARARYKKITDTPLIFQLTGGSIRELFYP